ncbi:MAG: extradiol ring-cleavage dioxygenase [Burkholderiales bacterium]|nr:MAG: extradiol ring-cleavage dioxygenase [Burkholderiales bacterium]
MGYLVAESNKLDEWKTFAQEGLGLHVEQPSADLLVFRVDDHQRRIMIRKGPAEDVVAMGWELDDQAALDTALSRLKLRGADIALAQANDAAQHGVTSLWRVLGPKKLTIELYTTPLLTQAPLQMKASGFVTGAAGLGHVAITTREPEAMLAFWQEVFDARLSDEIEDRIDGVNLDFSFLRLNERHHSIATASTRGVRLNPLRTTIHHMNLQAASLEDVTQGYLRCKAMGYEIANSIGQHPNDKELSFYVVTPSGFEVELGWNPISVKEEGWQPQRYRGISLWGHRPENLTMANRLGRFKNGLSSLARSEYTVQGSRT